MGTVQRAATRTATTMLVTGLAAAGLVGTADSANADPGIGWRVVTQALIDDVDGNGEDVGDPLIWQFTATNTGTSDIVDFVIQNGLDPVICPPPPVSVGQSIVCMTRARPVTQEENDQGFLFSEVGSYGRDADGDRRSSDPVDFIPLRTLLRVGLSKTATTIDRNGDGYIAAGDQIVWTFDVANTGSATIRDGFTVSDPLASSVLCEAGPIPAGETRSCTAAPYPVTADDVAVGRVASTATVNAVQEVSGAPTSATAATDTPVGGPGALALVKNVTAVDTSGDGSIGLGDDALWTFDVENTGDGTVSDIAVDDPAAGVVTCTATSLPPGGITSCTATPYRISQADIDTGRVTNTATASGTDSVGPVVSDPASATLFLESTSTLAVVASVSITDADGDGSVNLGDEARWSLEVSNTGTVSVSSITFDDTQAGDVTCPSTTLAAGRSMFCTVDAVYVIPQEAVDVGSFSYRVVAQGIRPAGGVVRSNYAGTDSSVAQVRRLALTITAATRDIDGDGRVTSGDTIVWVYTVTNTGTVVVSDLVIDDPVAGQAECVVDTLPPGGSVVCRSVTPRVVSAVDVALGVVETEATATGIAGVEIRGGANDLAVRSALGAAIVEVGQAVVTAPPGLPPTSGAPGGPIITEPGRTTTASGSDDDLAQTGSSLPSSAGLGALGATLLGGAMLVLGWLRRRRGVNI